MAAGGIDRVGNSWVTICKHCIYYTLIATVTPLLQLLPPPSFARDPESLHTYYIPTTIITTILNLIQIKNNLRMLEPWKHYFFKNIEALPKKWRSYKKQVPVGTMMCPAFYNFLDASSHLYMRLCPSVRQSVGLLVRPGSRGPSTQILLSMQ